MEIVTRCHKINYSFRMDDSTHHFVKSRYTKKQKKANGVKKMSDTATGKPIFPKIFIIKTTFGLSSIILPPETVTLN